MMRALNPGESINYSVPFYLIAFLLFVIAEFQMKNDLEDYYSTTEPINLQLSGVMTFFLLCGTSNIIFLGLRSGRKREFWSPKADEASGHGRHRGCRAVWRPGSGVSVSAHGVFLLPALPNLSHYALALSRLRQHARSACPFASRYSRRAPLQRFVHSTVSFCMPVAWFYLLSDVAV